MENNNIKNQVVEEIATKEEVNFFEEMAGLNVNDKVEKKGQFSYLSWAYAVGEMKKKDPKATWVVKRFPEGEHGIMVPYMKTSVGYFVEVETTFMGTTQSHIHPVLDNRNKPIASPTSFQINTSIMRCLVKLIGLHTGLGLYIYAGEDLPDGENNASSTPSAPPKPKPSSIKLASEKQVGFLEIKIKEYSQKNGKNKDEVKQHLLKKANAKDFKEMSSESVSKLIELVQKQTS